MRVRLLPRYGEPAVVVATLEQPIFDKAAEDSGSPFFREPLDLALGVIDNYNDFVIFYFDSRRFEPFQSSGR